MAIDLNQYLRNDFSVNKSVDAIRDAAQSILGNREFWGYVGQSSPVEWANEALRFLSQYDAKEAQISAGTAKNDTVNTSSGSQEVTPEQQLERFLDLAHEWITGTAQPKRAQRVQEAYRDSQNSTRRRIESEMAQIENVLAGIDDLPPDEQQRLRERAESMRADIQDEIGAADALGISYRDPVQVDGNFVPAGDETSLVRPAGDLTRTQRFGSSLITRQAADGTWEIIRENDGSVIEGGFTDRSIADQAMVRLNTGARQVGDAAPVLGSQGQIDTSGLTPEEIAAAEALADSLADTDLVTQPSVSSSDIQTYIENGIEQARTENQTYFDEVLGRAQEAYIQGLEVETRFRELELRQEALNRQQEFRATQENLEQRGATFSGDATRELGELSALPPGLRENVQGLMQQRQGILASTSQLRFSENLAERTRRAEELLGTQAVSGLLGNTDNPFFSGLLRYNTPTAGSLPREMETLAQTRGREIARGNIARDLATSPDFDTSQLLNYI